MNVVVTVGDVLDVAADVLISTANPWLNMSGGVNGAIHEREPSIQSELRAHLQSLGQSAIPAASVVRTSAGALPFSHIIHGFIFYGILTWLWPRGSLTWKLSIAVIIEAAWEILENTPWIINRYRESTISFDYFGDSVLNSISDIGAMVLGFWLAMRLPVWLTVTLAIAAELFVGWMIRDNLTLNVIMLLYPLDAIKEWQGAL